MMGDVVGVLGVTMAKSLIEIVEKRSNALKR
jgi:hypothetical protein